MRFSILLGIIMSIPFCANRMYADSGTEVRDTIYSVGEATELSILLNPSNITVSVKDVDGTGEDYYYKTGIARKNRAGDTSMTVSRNVSGLTIVEVDRKSVEISYTNSNREEYTLTYDIPDAENRFVKVYTGWSGNDISISLGRKGKSKWSLVSTGLGMGWATPVDRHPDFHTSMGHSMEWTWLSVLGVRWSLGPHSLTAGLGIYWRNYSLDKNSYFNKENGQLQIESFSENMYKRKSRLQTFSLELPLLYSLKFGRQRRFGMDVGPVVNFNTGANIKTQYREGDTDYSVTTHGIKQRPVTVDAIGVIRWEALGLYVRYSPLNVLRNSAGLDFKSFSTGIMFMF